MNRQLASEMKKAGLLTGCHKEFKERFKTWIFMLLLATAGSLTLRSQLAAQTFTTLHGFAATMDYINGAQINADGVRPLGDLIVSGNTLYGTTVNGGSSGMGTVFKLNTDGTGFTTIHTFAPAPSPYTNNEGISPQAGLVLSGNTLYGTAVYGGGSTHGTVFKVNTDGSGFAVLHDFSGVTDGDGGYPYAGLVLSGNTLYGTTTCCNGGTVFAVNTDGTGFTTLHSFNGADGSNPFGALILSGNTLYGTTVDGGAWGHGTVFVLNTDGTGFTNLYNFTGDIDGRLPYSGLVLSDNTLYGTTSRGGSSDTGTVFAVNISGTGFRTLHSFTGGSDGGLSGTGLILLSNTLYGTTQAGGSSGNGTLFAVNTDGRGFTVVHSFSEISGSANGDGAFPATGLTVSGNTLYGTGFSGGTWGNGTVFSVALGASQRLTFSSSQKNLVFTWPTNATGVVLQSTTNLASPVWTSVSPAPVVVNGQNTVTNPISGTQRFFRLSQ